MPLLIWIHKSARYCCIRNVLSAFLNCVRSSRKSQRNICEYNESRRAKIKETRILQCVCSTVPSSGSLPGTCVHERRNARLVCISDFVWFDWPTCFSWFDWPTCFSWFDWPTCFSWFDWPTCFSWFDWPTCFSNSVDFIIKIAFLKSLFECNGEHAVWLTENSVLFSFLAFPAQICCIVVKSAIAIALERLMRNFNICLACDKVCSVSWKKHEPLVCVRFVTSATTGAQCQRSFDSESIISSWGEPFVFQNPVYLIAFVVTFSWMEAVRYEAEIHLPLRRSSRFQRLFPNPSWLVWGRASCHQKLAPTFPGIDSCLMVTRIFSKWKRHYIWLNGRSQNVAKG